MSEDILTPSDARKRMDHIKRLINNPNDQLDVYVRIGALSAEILDTIAKHGDQRVRALMAVYQEIHKLADGL